MKASEALTKLQDLGIMAVYVRPESEFPVPWDETLSIENETDFVISGYARAGGYGSVTIRVPYEAEMFRGCGVTFGLDVEKDENLSLAQLLADQIKYLRIKINMT